jgi:hypothetical protein
MRQDPTAWAAERHDFALPLALHVETPQCALVWRPFDPSRDAVGSGSPGEIGDKALLHRLVTRWALRLRCGRRLGHITPQSIAVDVVLSCDGTAT